MLAIQLTLGLPNVASASIPAPVEGGMWVCSRVYLGSAATEAEAWEIPGTEVVVESLFGDEWFAYGKRTCRYVTF